MAVANAMAAYDSNQPPLRFGPFLLEPARRALTAGGTQVALSARAFDMLCVLVAHRARIVTRDELRAEVWRGMAVDENNLAVQMSVLRRALGEKFGGPQYILTVPGQGYQFVAPIESDAPPVAVPATPTPVAEQDEAAALPIAPAARGAWRWRAAVAGLIFILALAGLAVRHVWHRPAPRLSIVVLPFRNLSAEPEQDYLADAISDDLTTDLSHIPESVVIARASADTFRGRAARADEIGRALNVRYLLEGSIRAEGPALHINAQLIDAPTGGHLWARAFDVPRNRLGAARTDIVRSIATALDLTLVDIESARALHERPQNPDAVDLYLRARSILARGNSLAALSEAQDLLEKAVAREPQFSDALAALGAVLVHKIGDFDDPADARDYARAQTVIAQALAAAPRNPAAITANGYLAFVNRHIAEAQASFTEALALDANDLQARTGLALCAKQLGHMQDMIEQLQNIMQVDPAGPANARRQYQVGFATLLLGHPAEAITWLDRAGAGLQADATANATLGWQEWRQIYRIAATQLAGDTTEAARQYAAYSSQFPHRTVWRLAAYVTRPIATLPGQAAAFAALRQAGMPQFGREDEDFAVPPLPAPQEGSDFDPTPTTIPGARTIRTAELKTLLAATPKPILLDVGRGSAIIPGALWIWPDGQESRPTLINRALATAHAAPNNVIVVMGDGPVGWNSYNAVLQLVAQQFHSVLWYRGGDEAWASAGNTTEDRRAP